ncbi:MAG TPA: HAMP domain-containing sensor histidine kinase, partial [Flavobacterium sp.]|uniref:sensor histidine kinase n=1 Tax=Flavobacterium sp. TaxID=239 RepID=UPI002C5A2697
ALLMLFFICFPLQAFNRYPIKIFSKKQLFISPESNLTNSRNKIISTFNLDSDIKKTRVSNTPLLIATVSQTEKNFDVAPNEVTLNNKKPFIWGNIIFLLLVITPIVFYHRSTVKNLTQSKKETENKNESLTIANKELYRFVYSASHDLRSPLNSVKGLVEIAQEEENIHQIKDYLNLMHESLTRQDRFIGDIIDYSRNKRNLKCVESVSLNKLADEIIAQHQYMQKAHAITFKKDISVDEIIIDNLRLRIILNNLFSNAIKYSDDSKENKQITIKTYENNSSYVIEIDDNGIGIDEENLGKIFDMFFVANDKTGSGLGLYIVKEAAECLDGNIEVSSKKGIGTTFTLTLPKLI